MPCVFCKLKELTRIPVSHRNQGLKKTGCLVQQALGSDCALSTSFVGVLLISGRAPRGSGISREATWKLPETQPVGWERGSQALKGFVLLGLVPLRALPPSDLLDAHSWRYCSLRSLAAWPPGWAPAAQLLLQVGSPWVCLCSAVRMEVPRGAWGPSIQVIAWRLPGFQASVGTCVLYMLSTNRCTNMHKTLL